MCGAGLAHRSSGIYPVKLPRGGSPADRRSFPQRPRFCGALILGAALSFGGAGGVRAAEERGWESLLFVRERALGSPTSVVDSPGFFLAPRADWSPEAERSATGAAFVAAAAYRGDANKNPLCLFPARAAYLGFKRPACPELDEYLRVTGREAVSLVFSSYYANNPGSLFGHTFLRLHKHKVQGRAASDMLDDTVNFTAYPDTGNPMLYTIKGLMGRFPGRFSMLPFYMKIQEYSNSESRDLWEYELALTPAEVERLLLVFWELGPQTIDYYYFDENCALILLMALEAARPGLELKPLHPWVIPSDTLRAVARTPGLVAGVTYRPSVLTRFLARFAALSDRERALVETLMAENDAAQARALLAREPDDVRAAVIDAAVEYIDFVERLAGTKEAVEYLALRKEILLARTKIRVARAKAEPPVPAAERPDQGGGTARVGSRAVVTPGGPGALEASWRPALRGLEEPDAGSAPGLAITFFDVVARWRPETIFIDKVDLLTVRSAPRLPLIAGPLAWSVEVGAENVGACGKAASRCFEKHVRLGAGPSLPLGPVTAYALGKPEVGSDGTAGLPWFAGTAVAAGAFWPWSPTTKLSLFGEFGRRFGPGRAVVDRGLGRLELTTLAGPWEFGLAAERRPASSEFSAGIYCFY